MGNIFSGGVEDLILYYLLPSALLVLVLVTVYLERRAIRGLDAHGASWPVPLISRDDAAVQYRSPGMTEERPEAPAPVRRWVVVGTAWGVGLGACAALLSIGGLLLVTASPLAMAPLAAGAASGVACARVLTAALAMGDRTRAGIRSTLSRARRALVFHHLSVLLLGTSLLVLLVLSNRCFWNADPSYQNRQLLDFGLLYAALVLLPTLLGLALARGLHALSTLYPEGSAARASSHRWVSGS